MKKILKWAAGIIIILIGFYLIVPPIMKKQTKKHSPETTVSYQQKGYDLSVYYNRPSVKGRVIFGDLVPYGEVWRTGANEATVFTTGTDITINGKPLKAGTYTLWTIPGETYWEVIFNSKQYDWGVTLKGTKIQVSRENEYDVLNIRVPVNKKETLTEMFTIAFEEDTSLQMALEWEKTRIVIPIE